MVNNKIDISSTVHFHKKYQKKFDRLVGLDEEKNNLLFGLKLILDKKSILNWQKKHHKKGLPFLDDFSSRAPVVILTGEVGCGKTELALSVGSPLSKLMNGVSIRVFETPTNIRAGGYVGDISKRIATTFSDVKSKLKTNEYGILVIDEADDLATSREQMQAHHEDRAGVNVLIKEIDSIEREDKAIAIILITNRGSAIDPAIIRRASLHVHFGRPNETAVKELLSTILDGVDFQLEELDNLVNKCMAKSPHFTSSDIIRKVGENALMQSIKNDKALSIDTLSVIIDETTPSPKFNQNG